MKIMVNRLSKCSIRAFLIIAFVRLSVGQPDEELYDDNSEAEYADMSGLDVEIEVENGTVPEDRSDEDWVRTAVLDVAYYLRAHKFSDFDRRFYKEPGEEESVQYRHFPNPPLRYLHWEVNKYCDQGFYDCLAYLHDTVVKAELIRSMDTNTVMNERRWEFPRNSKSIEKFDKECNRLKAIDWRDADPFKGPLERFQWRVSASYFMCFFSMQELSPLIMFEERCDNFAGCLEDNIPFNDDPRGNNSVSYQCALYSFCPDVCCPKKRIEDLDECLDDPGNPCKWGQDRARRKCVFNRKENQDFDSIALNQWNVTCHCGPGFVWESMYGSCVDVDECSTGSHNCTSGIQTCLNLEGHYVCVCAWGYINITGTCVPNDVLTNALSGLHEHHHVTSKTKAPPISVFSFLYKWTIGLAFPQNNIQQSKKESPLTLEKENIAMHPENF